MDVVAPAVLSCRELLCASGVSMSYFDKESRGMLVVRGIPFLCGIWAVFAFFDSNVLILSVVLASSIDA